MSCYFSGLPSPIPVLSFSPASMVPKTHTLSMSWFSKLILANFKIFDHVGKILYISNRILLFYLGRSCSKVPTDVWNYAKAPFSHVIQNACVVNLTCDKTLLSMVIFNCVWQVICLLLFYPSLPDPLFLPTPYPWPLPPFIL